MSEPKEVVENNWYRAAKALRYAKDGLQQFIVEEIDRFHNRVYNKILQSLATGTACNKCALENIVPCPTRVICGHPKNCRFHDRNDPTKQPRPCPLNICSQVWQELEHNYRYGKPSCSNTNSQDWHCNAWELGKAFISTPGYKDKKTADDTDLPGLLSIISTFVGFQNLIFEDLSQKKNVFDQGRQLRNDVMHNARLEMPTVELKKACTVLTQMLSDPKQILHRPEAKLAVEKIEELRAQNIDISPKERLEFLQEAKDAIITLNDEKRKVLGDINDEKRKVLEQINAEESKVLERINAENEKAKTEIEKAKNEALQEIGSQTDDAKHKIQIAGQQMTDEIDSKKNKAVDQIQQAEQNALESIACQKEIEAAKRPRLDQEACTAKRPMLDQEACAAKQPSLDQEACDSPGNPEPDNSLCHDMLWQLINLYKKRCYHKMQVSPLIAKEDVEVETLAVLPPMKISRHDPSHSSSHGDSRNSSRYIAVDELETDSDNGGWICSIKELFEEGTEVCLSADAGGGKTIFCQIILSAWCKIQSNENIDALHLSGTDVEYLKSFKYLFYLPLRHLRGKQHVVEMIKDHLVRNKYHSTLDKILCEESEKCFIILDGLDEWNGKDLPELDDKGEYTVLLTSRCWKLEQDRLNKREVQLCELHKLCECYTSGSHCKCARCTFLKKLIKFLNEKYDKTKKYSECSLRPRGRSDKVIVSDAQEKVIQELSTIPILLTQMTCLWFDDKTIGNSRLEIYCNTIEILLETWDIRNKDDKNKTTEDKSLLNKTTEDKSLLNKTTEDNISLPNCFEKLKFCQKYKNVMYALSKLAYESFYGDKNEECLVFSHEDCDIHGLSQKNITFCLKVGLLCLSKFTGRATERLKVYSFLHKTFHEFFVALHIITGSNDILSYLKATLANEDEVPKIEPVLVFICGFRPDLCYDLTCHIATSTNPDSQYTFYRGSMRSIESCVLHCAVEACKGSEQTVCVRLHDVGVHPHIDTHMKHFLSTKESSAKIRIEGIKTYFNHCEDLPHHEIISHEKAIENAKILDVSLFSQKDVSFMTNIIKENISSLTMLKLCVEQKYMNILKLNDLLNAICSVKCLKYFKLSGFNCYYREKVGEIVSRQNHLEDITICGMKCVLCEEYPTCHTYSVDLSNHTDIRKLDLQKSNLILIQSVSATSNMVSSLQYLELCQVICSHSDKEQLGQAVSCLKSLKSLTINFETCLTCKSEHCCYPYNLDFSSLSKLKPLELENAAFCPMQCKAKSLSSVNLKDCYNIPILLESLHSFENLYSLVVEFSDFFLVLDSLEMHHCSFQQNACTGMQDLPTALEKALAKLIKLKHLKLTNVNLGQTNISRRILSVSLYKVTMTAQCMQSFIDNALKDHYSSVSMRQISFSPKDDLDKAFQDLQTRGVGKLKRDETSLSFST